MTFVFKVTFSFLFLFFSLVQTHPAGKKFGAPTQKNEGLNLDKHRDIIFIRFNRIFSIPDPGSASKNISILTQKIVF
jgi:hypothetical protein